MHVTSHAVSNLKGHLVYPAEIKGPELWKYMVSFVEKTVSNALLLSNAIKVSNKTLQFMVTSYFSFHFVYGESI